MIGTRRRFNHAAVSSIHHHVAAKTLVKEWRHRISVRLKERPLGIQIVQIGPHLGFFGFSGANKHSTRQLPYAA